MARNDRGGWSRAGERMSHEAGAGLVLVAVAADYAARAHSGQMKRTTGEPYLNHLAEVASLLAVAARGEDPGLVAAGWLHDAVEKGAATLPDLAARFGDDVAALVAEATDDPSLPEPERRRRQVEDAPARSPRARMLKLADKTSNLRAFARAAEAGRESRGASYLDWATAVAEGCRGLNVVLDFAFAEAEREARRAIGPAA